MNQMIEKFKYSCAIVEWCVSSIILGRTKKAARTENSQDCDKLQ